MSVKKALSIALCFVMVLMAAGCNNAPANSSSQAATPQPSQTGGTPAEPSQSGGESTAEVVRTPQSVSVATGPSTSVVYAVATTLGALWSDLYPEYTIVPEVTTGSSESMNLLLQGDVVIASGQGDVTYSLYNGTREYDDSTKGQVNFLCGGYYTVHHMIVPKNSTAQDLRDLKGKRVGVASGVMANFYWPAYCEAFGVSPDDFNVTVMSFNDIKAGLEDGILDFGIHSLSVPTSTISDLALNTGIRLLSIPDDIRDAMIAVNPYFSKYTIKSESYDLGYDTETLAITNGFNCRPDADEQMIYDFVKTLMENSEDISLCHPQATNLCNPETALLGQLIPIHPGAERYFREVGILK